MTSFSEHSQEYILIFSAMTCRQRGQRVSPATVEHPKQTLRCLHGMKTTHLSLQQEENNLMNNVKNSCGLLFLADAAQSLFFLQSYFFFH